MVSPSVSGYGIIIFLSSFIISLIGWLFIKPLISTYFDLKSENKKLFKFKRNYNLFKNTLFSERKVDNQNLQSDLFIGNKSAKLVLTIVTNPLCSFCKDTHLVINDLIKKHSNHIRINLFFNFKPEENDLKENDKITKLHLKLIDIYFNKNHAVEIYDLRKSFISITNLRC